MVGERDMGTADEGFSKAARILAMHPGRLRERVEKALLELSHIHRDHPQSSVLDVDSQMRVVELLNLWIPRQASNCPPGASRGNIKDNVAAMNENELAEVADEILWLHDAFNERRRA